LFKAEFSSFSPFLFRIERKIKDNLDVQCFICMPDINIYNFNLTDQVLYTALLRKRNISAQSYETK
jgi:hypothetical protein